MVDAMASNYTVHEGTDEEAALLCVCVSRNSEWGNNPRTTLNSLTLALCCRWLLLYSIASRCVARCFARLRSSNLNIENRQNYPMSKMGLSDR